MSITFKYQNNVTYNELSHTNLLVLVNTFLSDVISSSCNNLVKFIVFLDENVIDTIEYSNYVLKSATNNKTYNIKNNGELLNFIFDYSNLHQPSYNIMLKGSIFNKLTNFQLGTCQIIQQTQPTIPINLNIQSNELNASSTTLSPIQPINLNNQPFVQSNTIQTNSNTQSNVKLNTNQNDYFENLQNESNNNNVELDEDEKNMLEKMSDEEIKEVMSKLENIKKEIDGELSYNEEVKESRQLRKEKNEKRKREEKLSVFESDKTYTYKKIYADMFINTNKNGNHYIQSWEQIPELFVVKYAIFLFMDGRDTNGELVRERLLDKENEYEMYEILYNVLTDENYITPDDEYIREIVETFINTLPPIQIVTEEQIMKALNDPNDPIFNEDETSQCSADDDYGDTKIDTYKI